MQTAGPCYYFGREKCNSLPWKKETDWHLILVTWIKKKIKKHGVLAKKVQLQKPNSMATLRESNYNLAQLKKPDEQTYKQTSRRTAASTKSNRNQRSCACCSHFYGNNEDMTDSNTEANEKNPSNLLLWSPAGADPSCLRYASYDHVTKKLQGAELLSWFMLTLI